jgi:hypothetical protein
MNWVNIYCLNQDILRINMAFKNSYVGTTDKNVFCSGQTRTYGYPVHIEWTLFHLLPYIPCVDRFMT